MMKKLMQLLRDNARTERKPVNLVRADAGTEASIYVYDVIDSFWGVSAQEIANALNGLTVATLNVHINSPGGDVFEARAIKTLLDAFAGKVVVYIDGLAASAATTVAMAGDEIVMADGAYFMIHNAWSIAMGDKSDMRDMAALLEKMDGTICADYCKRCDMSMEECAALMEAETWMTAQEAVDAGFADRIAGEADADPEEDDQAAATNRWNLGVYDKTPKALTEKPAPATEPDMSAIHANNRRRLRLLEIA